MKEVEYRAVEGWPFYRVGNDGSVWTCHKWRNPTGEWRLLSHSLYSSSGKRKNVKYMGVHLSGNGKATQKLVHRLVLETFVGPCPPGMECRHLDGNSFNNRLDNLAWGTKSDNVLDKIRHGTFLRGSRMPTAVVDEDDVIKIKRMLKVDIPMPIIAYVIGTSKGVVVSIKEERAWVHIVLDDDVKFTPGKRTAERVPFAIGGPKP